MDLKFGSEKHLYDIKGWYKFEMKDTSSVSLDIFDEIGFWGVNALDFLQDLRLITSDKINLKIHSPGGDVFEATAIYNGLRAHSAKVVVDIIGYCASAATIIALAGDEVRAAENSYWMIHQPSTYGMNKEHIGDHIEEMKSVINALSVVEKQALNIYSSKTGLSMEKVEEMVMAETWLTASEAKELGFVDSITLPVKVAANAEGLKRRGLPVLPNAEITTAPESGAKKLLSKIKKFMAAFRGGNAASEIIQASIDSMVDEGQDRQQIMTDLVNATNLQEEDVNGIVYGSVTASKEQIEAIAGVLKNVSADILLGLVSQPQEVNPESLEDLDNELVNSLDQKVSELIDMISNWQTEMDTNLKELGDKYTALAGSPAANRTKPRSVVDQTNPRQKKAPEVAKADKNRAIATKMWKQ